jgi:hypothetical protein
MGYSLRTQAYIVEQNRQRHREWLAAQALADQWARENVDRITAAHILGVSPITLRRWAMATNPPRGPRFTKHGSTKQARTTYALAELRAYVNDPVAYDAARQAEAANG